MAYKATSMVQVITNISKAIDNESKVNLYSVKGSFKEFDMTDVKSWYQSAKIVNIKYHESNEKKFTPSRLKKSIRETNRDRTTQGIFGVAAGLKADLDKSSPIKSENQKISSHNPFKTLKNLAVEKDKINTSYMPNMQPEKGDSDDLSSNPQDRHRGDFKENNKINLKAIIQNIFKNIKNVFSKEETNQPNETLLRTTVIKKIILYLILAFIAMSSIYIGYLTIKQQYISYIFKIDSMYKTTVYHNMTISVINEFTYGDLIASRPLTSDYTRAMKDRDTAEVVKRLMIFKNQLNSLDIDTNVRNDLFFTSLGAEKNNFTMRYSPDKSNANIQVASKYTILMLMLEKVLRAEKSDSYKAEAYYFIDDNYLSIINKFFLDSFDISDAENDKIISDGKVKTIYQESGNSFHSPIRHDLYTLHSDDIRHQRGDQAMHIRSALRLQFHRQRNAK